MICGISMARGGLEVFSHRGPGLACSTFENVSQDAVLE